MRNVIPSMFLLFLAILQQRFVSIFASCADDTDFTVQGNKVCEYVRRRTESERLRLCTDNLELQEKCPVSCSICCEDNPNLLYNGSPACAQLDSLDDTEQQNICNRFQASFSCPVTCDTCPLPFELECEWRSYGSSLIGEDLYSQSGESISLSADGKTLAIGAYGNTPNQDYGIYLAGHVRVYSFDEGSNNWVRKGSDIDGDEECGFAGDSVSISDNGSVVALGAPWANNRSGKVQVYWFKEQVGDWVRVGGDLDNENDGDEFGYSVSLSSDGKIVAAGATDNSDFASNAGHVRVYYLDEESLDWVQMGSDIDGEAGNDNLGVHTSLSSDGKTLSVSAFRSAGGIVRVYSFDETEMEWIKVGNDIGSNQGHSWNGMSSSSAVDIVAVGDLNGIVKVVSYDESANDWVAMGAHILTDNDELDFFGNAISLSGDGTIMTVGAPFSDSVYVYNYDVLSMDWAQIGKIDGQDNESFGSTVSMSSNGQILAVGAEDYDCYRGKVDVFKYECSIA